MIESALAKVKEKMTAAMFASGRVDKVTLIGVTKNHTAETVAKAASLGIKVVGENRVQEARDKIAAYRGEPVEWHLIGHLQINKTKQAVELFSLIHSVDSKKLLAEINKFAEKAGKIQDVLLQINIACEANKSGMTLEDYPSIRDYALTLPNVRVLGMMCMAPYVENPEEVRPIFRLAYALYDDMKRYFPVEQIKYLSMGMSHDFEVAIEEGATMVRVGTALFGERNYEEE